MDKKNKDPILLTIKPAIRLSSTDRFYLAISSLKNVGNLTQVHTLACMSDGVRSYCLLPQQEVATFVTTRDAELYKTTVETLMKQQSVLPGAHFMYEFCADAIKNFNQNVK